MKRVLLKTVALMVCGFAVLSIKTMAQVNNYGYTTGTGAVLETGTFTNLVGTATDDGASAVTNIGFTFTFGGTAYTQFSASSNGLMRLGSTAVQTAYGNSVTGAGTGGYLSAGWDDLYTATDGNVQYLVTGTSPNRKLVVEWNVISCCPSSPADKKFQIWLYETTNEVRFVYGTGSAFTSSSVFIATSATDFQSVSTAANTVSTVTANDANSTFPASGRYYSFLLPPFDAAAIGLLTPAATGCFTNAENVTVRFKNNGTTPLDFSVHNTTLTVNVTGAVTQTFTTTLTDNSLNGGVPLAVADTLDVVVGVLNMSTQGTYTFNGSVNASDPFTGNDALPTVTRTVSAGTISVSSHDICGGDNLTLSLSNYSVGGTIQWQDSIPSGTWTNIAGATTSPYVFTPTDTAYYRAIVCGTMVTGIDVVNVNTFTSPTTIDTSRCGNGQVSLIASGNATIYWWDQLTGGNMLGMGDTLLVNVTSDTTFYAANGSGTPPTSYTTTFANNNGASGNMFAITAINTITITGFDVNTSVTGNWSIYYRPDNYALVPGSNSSIAGWSLVGTASNVPSLGMGVATPLPITFSITIPAGQTYSFHTISTGNANYTNGTGLNNVFSSNADLQFREGHGCNGVGNCANVPRVFNGNIHYTAGCQSVRSVLNVNYIDPPAISLTTANTTICDVDTITLTTTSANATYSYEYSPSTYLADTTGSSVDGWPQSDITYIVHATDPTGCFNADTLAIQVNHAPTAMITASDSVICNGEVVTFTANAQGGGTYNMTGPAVNILDNTTVTDTIVVVGAQNSLMAGDLVSVCMNITHTFDGDLDIYLQSPTGTVVELTTDNGSLGDNYTNTCFTMTAVTSITLGTAPFTGDFLPEGDLNTYNGENANGNWILQVGDDAGGDVGQLLSWTLTFLNYNFPLQWSSQPVGFSSTADTVMVTPSVSTHYLLTVTDSVNGCSRVYSEPVQVNQLPIVSLGTDTAICSNYAGITLDGTNAGAGTYLWQDGQTSATYFASLPGNYSVAVTDTNGCTGADTVVVGTVNAHVVSIDANLTAIHAATLDAGSGFSSYYWSTSATTQTVSVTNNGTYYVTCVDQNGCVSTDTMNIVFSLGIFNQDGSETTMQLYPNPSTGVFNVSINNLETGNLVIEVMDMNGKVVHNQVIGTVEGSTIIPFNLTNLSAGTYNMQLMANGKKTTLRFIVGQPY